MVSLHGVCRHLRDYLRVMFTWRQYESYLIFVPWFAHRAQLSVIEMHDALEGEFAHFVFDLFSWVREKYGGPNGGMHKAQEAVDKLLPFVDGRRSSWHGMRSQRPASLQVAAAVAETRFEGEMYTKYLAVLYHLCYWRDRKQDNRPNSLFVCMYNAALWGANG